MFLVSLKTFGKSNMKLLSESEKSELKNRILGAVGNVIRCKREQKNISGEMLGKCLDVTPGMISQYESGKADISVFKMALVSTYCGFSMSEYFKAQVSKELLDTFSKLVRIEGDRYKRCRKCRERKGDTGKILRGKVYQVDGKEVIEYIPGIDPTELEDTYTKSQLYLYGKIELEDVEPFSEEEFWEYLNREENGKKCTLLESVADILGYMGEVSQKERLKSSLAEYVIMELVINKTIADDMAAKRAYMYYKGLIEKEINS